MQHILVVGGAGYIGSHMVKILLERGFKVTVLDNLSTGHRDAMSGAAFVFGDLYERDVMDELCQDTYFDGVMHFASLIDVSESVRQPAKYYRNNVFKTQNLLDVMVAHRLCYLIFSSTAAIFGEPLQTLIDETHPKQPINPYGRSKWMVEQMLGDYDSAYGLKSVSLRYFNAAGADPAGQLGERHDPETHLIPLVLQAASGRRAQISVFGNDYPTPDGTGVRDYIHVVDLAKGHVKALQRFSEQKINIYNLGTGIGYSVLDIVHAFEKANNLKIPYAIKPRRAGDIPTCYADASKAKEELGWEATKTIEEMCRDSYAFILQNR